MSIKILEKKINDLKSNIDKNPLDRISWLNLGLFYREIKDYRNSLKALEKAHELGKDFVTYANLGDHYFELRDYAAAINYYAEAIQLNQNDFSVFFFLGVSLYNINRFQDALKVFSKCLELNPASQKINLFLGLIYSKFNQNFLAISHFKRELELNPDNASANSALGNALQLIGNADSAVHYYKKGTELNKTANAYSFLLYIMHHSPQVTDKDMFEVAQDFYQNILLPQKKSINLPEPKLVKKNKIRLGFVSMSYRKGTAEYAAIDTLKAINKEKFELYFYDFCPFNFEDDEVTDEYKALADKWIDIRNKDLRAVVDIISDDAVDILVDLVGHIKNNRMEIFACKPAPIQVSWLHYFGTTGIPEMDWLITNNEAVPNGVEKYYSERIYRIDGAYVPHKAKVSNIAMAEDLPFERNGYISFGSFNRFSKITIEVLELWAGILNSVESSRLIMSAKALEEESMQVYIHKIFAEKGISEDRLSLNPYPDLEEFYRQFNDVDIHLDPFPYNGGTTTFDSLYMGVPVVSLSGERWTCRFGQIIAKEVECMELIANTKEEYLCIVKDLAINTDKLKSYRKNLRDKFLKSDFFNYKKLAKNLEKAFEFMYNDYLSGNSSLPISNLS